MPSPTLVRTYRFMVDGDIPLKRRPRSTRGGHTYTDPKTVEDEKRVRTAFQLNYPGLIEPHDKKSTFQVYLWAKCPYPKVLKRYYPTLDLDNFLKAVLDALNKVLWEDDDQVVAACVFKDFVADLDGVPFVQVEVRELQ